MHEEELHLQLGDAAPQALPWPEPEAQPLEVLGARQQPALGAELLRLGEDLGVPAHGVETDLHQRLGEGLAPWGAAHAKPNPVPLLHPTAGSQLCSELGDEQMGGGKLHFGPVPLPTP